MSQATPAKQDRIERHLMRQRGTGARSITADFGFTFGLSFSSSSDPVPVLDPNTRSRKTFIQRGDDTSCNHTGQKASSSHRTYKTRRKFTDLAEAQQTSATDIGTEESFAKAARPERNSKKPRVDNDEVAVLHAPSMGCETGVPTKSRPRRRAAMSAAAKFSEGFAEVATPIDKSQRCDDAVKLSRRGRPKVRTASKASQQDPTQREAQTLEQDFLGDRDVKQRMSDTSALSAERVATIKVLRTRKNMQRGVDKAEGEASATANNVVHLRMTEDSDQTAQIVEGATNEDFQQPPLVQISPKRQPLQQANVNARSLISDENTKKPKEKLTHQGRKKASAPSPPASQENWENSKRAFTRPAWTRTSHGSMDVQSKEVGVTELAKRREQHMDRGLRPFDDRAEPVRSSTRTNELGNRHGAQSNFSDNMHEAGHEEVDVKTKSIRSRESGKPTRRSTPAGLPKDQNIDWLFEPLERKREDLHTEYAPTIQQETRHAPEARNVDLDDWVANIASFAQLPKKNASINSVLCTGVHKSKKARVRR